MRWSTSLMPTRCPANRCERFIRLRCMQMRPQAETTTSRSCNGYRGRASRHRVEENASKVRRRFHRQCFVRALGVEFTYEGIEAPLLLQAVHAWQARRFLLQRRMHALVTAILLRMARLDTLDRFHQPVLAAPIPAVGSASRRSGGCRPAHQITERRPYRRRSRTAPGCILRTHSADHLGATVLRGDAAAKRLSNVSKCREQCACQPGAENREPIGGVMTHNRFVVLKSGFR
jgi:hypothetical protein